MADLMVKGLTPNVSNGVSEINGSDKKTNKDAEPVFASLMCNVDSTKTQDSGIFNIAKTNIKTADNTLTPDSLRDKVVKEQPRSQGTKISPETADKIQQLNDKIKQAVMDEYDISEEELEQAMETLGLDYIQLLLPENLVKLSVEITGAADSLGLLSDPGFNQLYGMMQDLTAQITEELNIQITPETVDTFAEMIAPEAPVMAEAADQVGFEDTNISTENDLLNSAETLNETEINVDNNGVSNNNESIIDTEANAGLAQQVEQVITEGIKDGKVEVNVTEPQEPQAEEVDVQDQSENTIRVAGSIEDQAETNNSSQQEDILGSETGSKEKTQTTRTTKEAETPQTNNNITANFDNFRDIAQVEQVEAPQPLSQVDTESIIRQINDYMRINVSGPETSVEMQLNPENLGRVGINISIREGAVTAQLAVENAAVKQALESQMVILRENMNNQGLKVEAVEVTIASHEFEQNLENGAPAGQDGGQQQTAREGRGTRNLNASDLSLTDIEEMPEDQQLAAKIMRDNGNSMDVTA